jgi:dethiobiotin synthase
MSLFNSIGYFITGTTTDIGKTYISRLLADTFSNFVSVTYMKPIQTGCVRNAQGNLSAPDFEYMLKGKMTQTVSYQTHVSYCFEPACSPHLAAKLIKQNISLEHIHQCFTEVSKNRTILTLVEGAGGVMVPLGSNTLMIDLIHSLGLPAIVVTTPELGTLNHTLLTLMALKQRSIPIAGVVMNNCRNIPKDFIYSENLSYLRNATHPAPFCEVPFGGGPCKAIEEFCRELI